MSARRAEGDPCPLDEAPLNMDKCQPCRFFRGASLVTGRKGWMVVCNFPRNGSEIYWEPIPEAFREAFD